jgi:hypothetical protein
MEDDVLEIDELLKRAGKTAGYSLKEIRSLMEKRCPELDGLYPISDINPSKDDLRDVRDIMQMAHSLDFWGQIYPIIINIINDVKYNIDGTTRIEGAKTLNWENISCIAFKDLTDFECDCLNTAANAASKGFNKDEILNFIKKNRDRFPVSTDENIKELSYAFGYKDVRGLKEVFSVLEINDTSPEVSKYFKQRNPGRDRGEYDYRRAGIVSGVIDHKEAFVELAEYTDSIRGRDTEKTLKAIINKTDELIHRGYSESEAVSLVKSRGENITKLERLGIVPHAEKFKMFEQGILSYTDFDEVIIANPTLPSMKEEDGNEFDSEAVLALKLSEVQGFKVIIVDRVKEETDIWKDRYGSHPNLTIVNKPVEEFLFDDLEYSNKETLIHFNFGGGVKSRRFISPKILKSLKDIRKNLMVSLVCVESFDSNLLEQMEFFGFNGDDDKIETFDQFFSKFEYRYKIIWNKLNDKVPKEMSYGFKALVIIDLGRGIRWH